jgi:hypothetical protein
LSPGHLPVRPLAGEDRQVAGFARLPRGARAIAEVGRVAGANAEAKLSARPGESRQVAAIRFQERFGKEEVAVVAQPELLAAAIHAEHDVAADPLLEHVLPGHVQRRDFGHGPRQRLLRLGRDAVVERLRGHGEFLQEGLVGVLARAGGDEDAIVLDVDGATVEITHQERQRARASP